VGKVAVETEAGRQDWPEKEGRGNGKFLNREEKKRGF